MERVRCGPRFVLPAPCAAPVLLPALSNTEEQSLPDSRMAEVRHGVSPQAGCQCELAFRDRRYGTVGVVLCCGRPRICAGAASFSSLLCLWEHDPPLCCLPTATAPWCCGKPPPHEPEADSTPPTGHYQRRSPGQPLWGATGALPHIQR